MKKFAILAVASSLALSGCYGSYTLTKKVYNWTGGLGQPASTVVNWVGVVVGVPLLAIDFLFLNTLEYWTGSNPLAMSPGQVEKRVTEIDGQSVEITTTRGQVDIKTLTGAPGTARLSYSEAEQAWYIERAGERKLFAQLDAPEALRLR